MEDGQQQVKTRWAVLGDLNQVCQIYSESFAPTKPSKDHWLEILASDHILCRVAEKDGEVIGVAVLVLVVKVLRSGSIMGLIEDVAVSQEARGLGVGKLLIEDLVALANEWGCYKVVLNCSDANVAFYEKCGFRRAENQMRIDL